MLILSPRITGCPQVSENVRDLWLDLSPCLLFDATEETHDQQASADVVVIDYLQVPGSAAELFCSAVRFLRYQLGRRIEPLVMAFDERVVEAHAQGAIQVANTPVSAGFGEDDRMIWLQIDEITASGPLLPVFAEAIRTEGLTDRQFADLLSSGFEG